MGSLKSASLNDILKEQLIVVLKFCLCIIVLAFDLLQLPQIFGERSFSANISPHPFIVCNTDGTYTVVADTSVSVVVCQDKSSAVTGLFAVYWIFDIQFAAAHKRTMELFEKAVFKLNKAKPGQAVQRILNAL